MLAVSDSTALMHLAKIERLDLLKSLFKKIYIPLEVYDEIFIRGKERYEKETILIEKNIKENFIEKKDASSVLDINSLHIGEVKAISLCKDLGIKNLLV